MRDRTVLRSRTARRITCTGNARRRSTLSERGDSLTESAPSPVKYVPVSHRTPFSVFCAVLPCSAHVQRAIRCVTGTIDLMRSWLLGACARSPEGARATEQGISRRCDLGAEENALKAIATPSQLVALDPSGTLRSLESRCSGLGKHTLTLAEASPARGTPPQSKRIQPAATI